MTIRMFFTILAALSFVFGVGFVLAPDQVLAIYGIEHSPALALLGVLLAIVSLVMFQLTHRALGRNWSVSLDVRVDNLLEPTSALGGIHTTRRGRAAEQSKSHREISCSRRAGAAVLAAGGLLKRPAIPGMSIAVRAQTVAPTSCKHGERELVCASSTPFAGITQTGSTGLISAHVIRAPRSYQVICSKR